MALSSGSGPAERVGPRRCSPYSRRADAKSTADLDLFQRAQPPRKEASSRLVPGERTSALPRRKRAPLPGARACGTGRRGRRGRGGSWQARRVRGGRRRDEARVLLDLSCHGHGDGRRLSSTTGDGLDDEQAIVEEHDLMPVRGRRRRDEDSACTAAIAACKVYAPNRRERRALSVSADALGDLLPIPQRAILMVEEDQLSFGVALRAARRDSWSEHEPEETHHLRPREEIEEASGPDGSLRGSRRRRSRRPSSPCVGRPDRRRAARRPTAAGKSCDSGTW